MHHRTATVTAVIALGFAAGIADAHNYNNTRSNRVSIVGGGVDIQWNTAAGVLLDVGDFDGDGFGGPPASISTDPALGADLFALDTLVFLPGRNLELVVPIFPVNDRPSVGSAVTVESEEFGGSGMNLARLVDSVSFDTGGFFAETDASTMITDLGTSVAVSSDRITLQASSASTFALDVGAFGGFDLDLQSGQDAFAGVIINLSFGIIGGTGDTVLLSDSYSTELDTLTGLNRNGVTDIAVGPAGDVLSFQLAAGSSYFLNIDTITYSQIVPAPGAFAPIALASVLVSRRRRMRGRAGG